MTKRDFHRAIRQWRKLVRQWAKERAREIEAEVGR